MSESKQKTQNVIRNMKISSASSDENRHTRIGPQGTQGVQGGQVSRGRNNALDSNVYKGQ